MDSFGKTRDPLLVHLHFPLSKTYRGLFYLSMLYHNSPKESIPLVFRLFLPALSGFWINRVQLLGDLGVIRNLERPRFNTLVWDSKPVLHFGS
jgi:hypothetical protein